MTETFLKDEIQAIINSLWSPLDDGSVPHVFMVLDCARDKRMEPLVNKSQLEHSCLYAGKLSYALKRAAPHLVKLTQESDFTKEVLMQGWGQSWGIFIKTTETVAMASVRNNCRKISKVLAPNGKVLVFRYHDPRVLRKFLPLCDKQQIQSIFGQAASIVMENEQAEQLIEFNIDNNTKLSTKVFNVCLEL